MGVACVAIDAFAIEPYWLSVTRHTVAVPGLPAALEGFTTVQITDAHLTGLGTVEDAILEHVRRIAPQLVVLTGDLIDHVDDAPVLAQLCQELGRGGVRVVSTLGNWEHWGKLSLAELRKTYAGSNANLLINEWDNRSDNGVAVWGTDDATAGAPTRLPEPSGAAVEVLLTHSPAFVDDHPARDQPFALCLAGHTHGGQLRAGSLAPVLPPGSGRFVAGWYATPMGQLYVSVGTGTSIVPARLCCRPELPVFTLTRG